MTRLALVRSSLSRAEPRDRAATEHDEGAPVEGPARDWVRPSHRLPPEAYPEWLQMEVDAVEAEHRRARRLELAKVALIIAGVVLSARVLLALAA